MARRTITALMMAAGLALFSGCSGNTDSDPELVARKFVATCLADMHKTRWKLLDSTSKARISALAQKAPKKLDLLPRDFLMVRPVASEYWAGALRSKVLESSDKRALVEVTSVIGRRKSKVILSKQGSVWKVVLHTPGMVR